MAHRSARGPAPRISAPVSMWLERGVGDTRAGFRWEGRNVTIRCACLATPLSQILRLRSRGPSNQSFARVDYRRVIFVCQPRLCRVALPDCQAITGQPQILVAHLSKLWYQNSNQAGDQRRHKVARRRAWVCNGFLLGSLIEGKRTAWWCLCPTACRSRC